MNKVVVFEQDNCSWCVRLHPHIEKLSKELDFGLDYVNISKQGIPEGSWGSFMTTPTVFVVDGDNIVGQYDTVKGGIAGIINGVKEHFSG